MARRAGQLGRLRGVVVILARTVSVIGYGLALANLGFAYMRFQQGEPVWFVGSVFFALCSFVGAEMLRRYVP